MQRLGRPPEADRQGRPGPAPAEPIVPGMEFLGGRWIPPDLRQHRDAELVGDPDVGVGLHVDVHAAEAADPLDDRDVVDELRSSYGAIVTTPVREAVAARDAYTSGMATSVYAPESGVAADYAAAIATILNETEQS